MAEVATPQIKVQQPPESSQAMAFSPPKDGVIISRDADPRSSSEARPQSNGKGFPAKLIRPRTGNRTSSFSNSEGRRNSNTGIDPLSKHIFERTRADTPQRTSHGDDRDISPTSPSRMSTEPTLQRTDSTMSMSRDNKKNRVSFLSRFMNKRKDSIEIQDEEDDITDRRAEGANAEAFSQPLGYIPKYPEPPKYIKVRSRGKKEKDFDRVFLAQELRGRTGVEVAQAGGRRINPSERAKQGDAIWALEFSKDGRYLAAGGHDHIVRVWAVLATEEDRASHEKMEELAKDQTKLSAPVFKASPVQEYEGHTATVLDLSWSKNNFLLSSSMDKTVRLWHTSRSECLCAFKHSDFVTSIQFHPRDDRFFLAGSLDSKLRLWSIPDKTVAHWSQPNELITAVEFTPDGKTAIAGCLSGACIFYETEGLRQQTQMHVRSAHGKNSKGSKITGIQAINYPPSDPNGDVKVLVTSNDSRVRVYNLRDKGLELKLKGVENTSSQIRASFTDDAKYIISGSEDKKAYIWSTGPPEKDKDKRPMEMFEAHGTTVTAAISAPARTRQLLQASGDPLFDLCNPPPIQLISRADSHSSRDHASTADDASVPATPAFPKRPSDSPTWLARSAHPNGNILITADFAGHIKVFRQDCAWRARAQQNDIWDTASTFSKRVLLHRSSSIATRHSRASGRESLAGGPSERILSWRQSIDRASGSPSINSNAGPHDGFGGTGVVNPPHRSTFANRSKSPNKRVPGTQQRNGSNSHPLSASSTPSLQPQNSFAGSERSAELTPNLNGNQASKSTPAVLATNAAKHNAAQAATLDKLNGVSPKISDAQAANASNGRPGLLSATSGNPLLISDDSGTSAAFYDRAQYEILASNTQRRGSVDINGNPVDGSSLGRPTSLSGSTSTDDRTGRARAESGKSGFLQRPLWGTPSKKVRAGSRLSSAATSEISVGSEVEEEDEGERCSRCGSENFRSRKRGAGRVLECVRCGKVAA